LFGLAAGGAFFEQVYAYHLRKTRVAGEASAVVRFAVAEDWPVIVFACAGAVWLGFRGRSAQRVLALLGVAAGAHVVFVLTRNRIFAFYFVPAAPALALLVGVATAGAVEQFITEWRRGSTRAWLPAGLLTAAAVATVTPRFRPGRPFTEDEAKTYVWQGVHALGPVDDLVRGVLWAGGNRTNGGLSNPLTEDLWRSSLWLDVFDDLTTVVREEARRKPGTTLLGDSGVAPLVAAASGVRLAGDLADTNGQRFDAGTLTLANLEAIVSGESHVLVIIPESTDGPVWARFREQLRVRFSEIASFVDAAGRPYSIFRSS
jgi:hypothetical protein